MSNQASVNAILDALGDQTRRDIIEALRRGPRPVGELAAELPVGRPAVSKHLRVLEGAGLVEHRSIGTRNLYALAPAGLAALQQWLVQTWDTSLAAYADRVRQRATQHAREDHDGTREAHPPAGRRPGRA